MAYMRIVDEFDHSLAILAIAWFALASTTLIIFLRLTAKLYFRQTLRNVDDYLVLVSFAFFLGQTVSIDISARHGLGKESTRRQTENITTLEKTQYSANLLAVVSLCFSRLAYLGFIKALVPNRRDKNFVNISASIVILWAVVSFLVNAFQCQAESPWNYTSGKCFNRVTWAVAYNAINVAIDAQLVLIPLYILSRLSSGISKKINIMCYFGTRLLVVAASLCASIFSARLNNSSDQIRDIWIVQISTQIILAFSIVSSIILYLKPFISSIEAGFYANEDIRRRGSEYATEQNSSYRMSTLARRWRSRVAATNGGRSNASKANKATATSNSDQVTLNRTEAEGSPADIIRATTTWSIRSEEASSVPYAREQIRSS